GLALVTRAIVSEIPEPGLGGLTVWLGHSVVPAALGVALWWRGAMLFMAELTAADVRMEFGILAICLIAALSLVRPFLLPDPTLLGASVGLFALGGLIAVALSRQDAARISALRFDHLLASSMAIVPAVAAVFLVSLLRPELLGTLWSTLARVIELIL